MSLLPFVDYKSNTCLWYKSHEKDRDVSGCSHPKEIAVASFPHQRTSFGKHSDHSSAFHGSRVLPVGGNRDTNSTSSLIETTSMVFNLKDSSLKHPAVSCLTSPRSIFWTLLWGSPPPTWQGLVGAASSKVSFCKAEIPPSFCPRLASCGC